jgi:hypothetical protein
MFEKHRGLPPSGEFWRLRRPRLAEILCEVSEMYYTGIQMAGIRDFSRLVLRLEATCIVRVP